MSDYDPRLADRVRTRGVLGPDDAARLLLPVAESVASIHAVSGTHGAISPSAIQVDASGRATLLDRTRVDPDPAYVVPDPALGLRPDPAADVWALGGVLLFVTTGQPPRFGQGVPRDIGWLGPVTELALRPSPRERPTMAEVADYLRAPFVEPDGRGAAAAEHRRRLGIALAGAAAIVALAMIGAALLFSGDGSTDQDADDRARSGQSSPEGTASEDTDPEGSTETVTAEPVTADDLEDFARDYVATASSRPDEGFARLTADYQRASPRYREVWSAIQEPEILSVTGDPGTLSVTYTYRYRLAGDGRRTEEVTLRLVDDDGELLIAGASARPL